MLTSSIVLALALLQQPGHETPAARAARLAAFDTSKAAMSHLGVPVAEVKSALDVYRRAVFNGTDDEVQHNADYLRTSCQAVDSVARLVVAKVCRHCAAPDAQAAFDRYRQDLPSLSRGAARCAARIRLAERGADAAKRLRRDVRDIGNGLILTLRAYEARLAVLRNALNLTHTTRPPASRPGPARP
jgi:hypothetical protein